MRHVIKAAAAAAGLALAAYAAPASALEVLNITHTSMDTAYTATIHYTGGGSETAYSNGVTFTGLNLTTGDDFEIFGFCIDVFHNITLGNQNLTYDSTYNDPAYTDLPATDFGSPALSLSTDQKNRITSLVDYGYVLHRDHAGEADAELQLAAIQAAIWDTILSVPGPGNDRGYVTVNNGNHSAGGETYAQYFYDFTHNTYTGDRIYEIFDTQNHPAHQAFAIGWPIEGVPEPATWALMLGGFFGMGAMLRRRRALTA